MALPYATAFDLKRLMSDALPIAETKYDQALRLHLERASRLVEQLTKRRFFPYYRVYRINVTANSERLWLPETCLTLTTVEVSDDDGAIYTPLTGTDYYKYGGDRLVLDERPYLMLEMAANGDYGLWYRGQNSIRLTGEWGFHDDYVNAWEDSGSTVQNDPKLTSSGTSILVTNADVEDVWADPVFRVGQVLKIEAEAMELLRVDEIANTLTVRRAVLGTTAVDHLKNVAISIYVSPALIKHVVTIQASRWFRRGQQAWNDTSASNVWGQWSYTGRLDPDIIETLYGAGLIEVTV